jgi:hypothetical protein
VFIFTREYYVHKSLFFGKSTEFEQIHFRSFLHQIIQLYQNDIHLYTINCILLPTAGKKFYHSNLKPALIIEEYWITYIQSTYVIVSMSHGN